MGDAVAGRRAWVAGRGGSVAGRGSWAAGRGVAFRIPLDRRSLRLAVGARRRLLAALLAALAAVFGVAAARPAAPTGVPALVAARDLPAGIVLHEGDVSRAVLPAGVVPSGVLHPTASAIGRSLAGPMRRGEPLTDVRVLGPGLFASLAELARLGGDASDGSSLVAAPIRVADPGAVGLLRPGDRVDVLAAAGGGSGGPAAGTVRVVADRVLVLAVPRPDGDLTSPGAAGVGTEGALVVLATPRRVATALAGAAVTSRLSVTLRGP